VKAEKTKTEREAAADRMLSSSKKKIQQLDRNIADLDNLLQCVRLKRRDLSGTESRLRNQMKMVQESLTRLSATWKRKTPPKDKEEIKNNPSLGQGAEKGIEKALETSSSLDEEQMEIDRFLNSIS
jgi:hypothetical protein